MINNIMLIVMLVVVSVIAIYNGVETYKEYDESFGKFFFIYRFGMLCIGDVCFNQNCKHIFKPRNLRI